MLCLSFRIVSAKAVILHPFSLLSPRDRENRLSFSSRRRDALSFIMGYLELVNIEVAITLQKTELIPGSSGKQSKNHCSRILWRTGNILMRLSPASK